MWQVVRKINLGGWILRHIIAFLPFLISVRAADKFFNKLFSEQKAAFIYYLVSGGIGLAVEWFLIGLSPWSNPNAQPLAMLVLQIGMFSFWCGVAFAPRLLLDQREFIARVRTGFKRFLIAGMAVIYFVTFASPKKAHFLAGIGSVLIVFISLNFYYLRYFRELRRQSEIV